MPSDPNAKRRIVIAFLCLVVVFSAGTYFVVGLTRLPENISARESRAALQGVTDPGQIEEALRQHPSNKFLQMVAMATRAADETSTATEKLSDEVAPPAVSKNINLGAASRGDLDALRRDLKTAQANAETFGPRFGALLKAERDNVKKYALSLQMKEDTVKGMLDNIDKRHAEITAFTAKMLPARAEFYRAYENYVAFLAGEFGTYKVVDGQFIFPFQRTVDRYNVAANAMTAAAKHVTELEEERKNLMKAARERWMQFVNGI
jgi:hypothetical protein